MKILLPDDTILGLIAIQNCHGYELLDTFRRPNELGAIWKMSTSQIYAVLKRLEKTGLIIGTIIESWNAPSRTEYTLSAEGEARLQAWLYDPEPSASIRRVRVEFLSRLYIARQLNRPTIPIVQHQRTVCQTEYQRLLQMRTQKSPGMAYLAHEFVIAQLEAVLSWIERCELVPREPEE